MITRIAAVTTATAIILVGVATLLPPLSVQIQPSYAFVFTGEIERKAPIATVGDNVYIVWFTDKGTPNNNGEVMFKASNNSGKTFGPKVNLSNSPATDSINVGIAAAGSDLYVSWWERNATSNEPLLRISNDNGKTFGEKITLSAK
jgi:hypothetical protein